MAGKNLLKFNAQNGKYALLGESATIKSIGKLDSVSLEADYSEQKIYGDGYVIDTIPSDKGLTGALATTLLNDEYEIDMGRKIELATGLADIKQLDSIPHNIYFEIFAREIEGANKGKNQVVKVWLLNVTTGKPGETFKQNEDGITVTTYENSLTVLGVPVKAATGEENYRDANGNEVYATKVVCYPDMVGYATFGDSVPVPKMKASV